MRMNNVRPFDQDFYTPSPALVDVIFSTIEAMYLVATY